MKAHRSAPEWKKRARKGFRGYPVATVAFYGSDAAHASKVAVGIVLAEGSEPAVLERWFSERTDVRFDAAIATSISTFLRAQSVKTVVVSDGIIGCPHEEGVDYPEGSVCLRCPYWANRDRWTGELLTS